MKIIAKALLVFATVIAASIVGDWLSLPTWLYPFVLVPALYLFQRLSEDGRRPHLVPLLLLAATLSILLFAYSAIVPDPSGIPDWLNSALMIALIVLIIPLNDWLRKRFASKS